MGGGAPEPHALAEHEEGLMRCFADEYAACGGPCIRHAELLRQWRLLYVVSFVGQIQARVRVGLSLRLVFGVRV